MAAYSSPWQNNKAKVFALKIPAEMHRQVEAIARRDATTMAGTMKRLVSAGLRLEHRRDEVIEP